MMNPRWIAYQILYDVVHQAMPLDRALEQYLSIEVLPQDQRFIQSLCFGVCRYYWRLQAIIHYLLTKPLKKRDQGIALIIALGLYQLVDMRVPAHAAVAETVALVSSLEKSWAKGLVNAALRNFQRQRAQLSQRLQEDEASYYSHPQWLLDKMISAWPNQWQAMAKANLQPPPMSLRVNLNRIQREAYLQELMQQGMVATPSPLVDSAVVLSKPVTVEKLPGFAQGFVSVQDIAAQLAVSLLDLQPGQRVLDACAAPGGKACHIVETRSDLAELVCVEKSPARLTKVKQNLQRLRLSATLINADAVKTSEWWDGQCFDRILLDAPCSATGVIRRHPDIMILRQAHDVADLVALQAQLLHAMWSLLKPGGKLVYATCSILPEENSQQIKNFLSQHLEAQCVHFSEVVWGHPQPVGRQVLPGEQQMDGFYYAVLARND